MNNGHIEFTTPQGKRIRAFTNFLHEERVRETLTALPWTGNETKDRMLLMEALCAGLKADVMYDGNTVYNMKNLLKDLRKIVKEDSMDELTPDLYNFFIRRCGSIAHFSRRGWISEYPTVGSLRSFFQRNEYGQHVYRYVRNADERLIVEKMLKILKLKVPEPGRWDRW